MKSFTYWSCTSSQKASSFRFVLDIVPHNAQWIQLVYGRVGYYVLGLFLIKYGLRGPSLDQLRHLNFLGPLGVQGGPQGGQKGVKMGHFGPLQKLLISSTFFSRKQ